MKKLINDPRDIVAEMLEGLVALAPGQALLQGENVVLCRETPPAASRPVAVISGGGAGHEPAHAGYVGAGMLAAAVAGDVFTSPSVDAVLAAIHAVAGPRGALLIVKNYTGDRLNFGLAAEIAIGEGIPVEIVTVADDVALRDLVEPARRRGIAGTVLVHKIAGAAAARGDDLATAAALARRAAAGLASMGVALSACTVPAAGRPGFELGPQEIELGLGIHGEKGVARAAMAPADALVDRLLSTIAAEMRLAAGARLALLVNGLGGTPPMELAIVARHALAALRGRGAVVERAWCGNFMTALDMQGVSLSLLAVDDALLELLDAPAGAPAWPGAGRLGAPAPLPVERPAAVAAPARPPGPLADTLRQAGLAVAAALEAAEARLTELDSAAGDGDLGASMTRGAAAIRALPDDAWATPETLFLALGHALRRAIGGSSGPFYATALMRAGRRLAGQDAPDRAAWLAAFADAVAAIGAIGGAAPGDRTMLDALQPAVAAWAGAGALPPAALWAAAAAASRAGAEATAAMLPRAGRASYLGARVVGIPDGGAVAVTVWMDAITPFVR